MPESIYIKLVGLFIFVVSFSILLNSILLKFSRNLGKRNTNENLIRWSEEAKPSLGGISFYIAFLTTFSFYSIFFNTGSAGIPIEELGLLTATGLAFLMGLSDDAYNTKPLLKFTAQVICGVILIVTNTYIKLFPIEGINYAITIFWVVAVMNSINMLDNMDAITTVVSIFILLMALLVGALGNINNLFYQVILLGSVGSLFGFLYFNWHPSKMFMGDTGSQFLGIFLAAVGIKFFWNNTEFSGVYAQSKGLSITLISFIIPISDTLTVIINRLRRGQSPFVGGKDHTTHHLSYLGLSDSQVGWAFIGISTISLLLVVLIEKFLAQWSHLYTIAFVLYFLAVFSLLYSTTQSKRAKKKYEEVNS